MNKLHMTTEGMPFPPSVNHYMGYRAVKKGRGAIVMAYTTKEAKEFQKVFGTYLEQLVKETGWDKEQTRDTHYYLDMTFYFDKKGKDESNYTKVMNDLMNERVIIDDKHLITRTHAVYLDKNRPRIEMLLHPVEYKGIFPTKDSANEFESKCLGCTRFLDGRCSIFRDSNEGRVREEVEMEYIKDNKGMTTHENISCTKYKEKK